MQAHNWAATAIAVVNLIYAVGFVGLGLALRYAQPLRVTAFCTLLIAFVLLLSAGHGVEAALFPGLASACFGIGNLIQSSGGFGAFRAARNGVTVAYLHPAIWYGFGYTMTGIAIGGGLPLLESPAAHPAAAVLTAIGVAETFGSLIVVAFGKVRNPAWPFIAVACGTLVFATTGLLTGNYPGCATGIFACAGELSLARLVYRQNDAMRVSVA